MFVRVCQYVFAPSRWNYRTDLAHFMSQTSMVPWKQNVSRKKQWGRKSSSLINKDTYRYTSYFSVHLLRVIVLLLDTKSIVIAKIVSQFGGTMFGSWKGLVCNSSQPYYLSTSVKSLAKTPRSRRNCNRRLFICLVTRMSVPTAPLVQVSTFTFEFDHRKSIMSE